MKRREGCCLEEVICRVLVAALTLSAVPASRAGADPAGTGALGGRVTVERGGPDAGLAGVEVRLAAADGGASRKAGTGPRGEYGFTGLAPGRYAVTVECPGFEPFAGETVVVPGVRTVLDVSLALRFGEAVTVTATRTERVTEEVPAAVSVVGRRQLETTPMTNVKDALDGMPGTLVSTKNEGYDSRLIIRGAGLKARYGIREIMVLLNGIPITDPDSLTRLDFVNTRLIERVEVVRGPGSTIWGINATGGTINVITKDPLQAQGGVASVDVGSFGASAAQAGYTLGLSDRTFMSLDVTRRSAENDWRPHNRFSTTQVTFQPWFSLPDGSLVETFLSYTDASLQLPGALVENRSRGVDQWTPYLERGTVEETADPWRDSARDSKVLFAATRLHTTFGALRFEPVAYANVWSHFHPVTGKINDAVTFVGGADLPVIYDHGWGSLAAGVTARYDRQQSEAYAYADVLQASNGRLLSTLSDRKGERMEKIERTTSLYGAYAQESLRLGRRVLVDVGVRFDRVRFETRGHEWLAFDYSAGRYVPGEGVVDAARTYEAFSPRISGVLLFTPRLSVYGSVSTGVQTPTSDELTTNPGLDLTTVLNYEVGAKGRFANVRFDSAVYLCTVKDEVVQVAQGYGVSEYVNAGRTRKLGAELWLAASPWPGVEVGGSYSYSDFTFVDFSESQGGINLDRSGNRLPLVPRHLYSVFAGYRGRSGVVVRGTASTWGRYFVDNANSETYPGYSMVADLAVGYQGPRYEVMLIAQNLFDDRYSVETQRDLQGVRRYVPAAPRALRARFGARF